MKIVIKNADIYIHWCIDNLAIQENNGESLYPYQNVHYMQKIKYATVHCDYVIYKVKNSDNI